MPAQVAIIGDTHVPSRAPSIPEWIEERAREADHLLHVGDFDSEAALATVEEFATDLTAVRGNLDPDGLDLPEVDTLDVGEVRFVVTHGTGSPRGWAGRVAGTANEHAAADRTTVAVAGHIHEVVDREHDGVRILNPGSATGARPASEESMMTAEVDGAELTVEVHRR